MIFLPDVFLVRIHPLGASGAVVVVSGDEEFHGAAGRTEHPVPRICVKLHFLDLSAMRHVAAMKHGIDVLPAKMLQRGDNPFVRPVFRRILAVSRRPEMRVANDAKDEIRLSLRLPTDGSREKTARQRKKSQRCQAVFYELSASRFHIT